MTSAPNSTACRTKGRIFSHVTVHHVAAGSRVGAKDQRLDHQRHSVAVALRFDLQNIPDALVGHLRFIGNEKEIDDDTSRIEPKCLLHRILNHAAEERARKVLPVHVRHVGAKHERRLVSSWNGLQKPGLTHCQLNGVWCRGNQRVNRAGEVFDAREKSILVEKSMVHRDVKTTFGLCVKETIQTIRFHGTLLRTDDGGFPRRLGNGKAIVQSNKMEASPPRHCRGVSVVTLLHS